MRRISRPVDVVPDQVKRAQQGEGRELVAVGKRRVNISWRGQAVRQSHESGCTRRTAQVARQPHEQDCGERSKQSRRPQGRPVIGRPVGDGLGLGRRGRCERVRWKAKHNSGQCVGDCRRHREAWELVAVVVTMKPRNVAGLLIESVEADRAPVDECIGQDQTAGGIPVARVPEVGVAAQQGKKDRDLHVNPGRSHQVLEAGGFRRFLNERAMLASGRAASKAAGAWIGSS